jgi:hypothetical protein
MLLPKYWLRQQKLGRSLSGYPLYNPPHKAEERILEKEKAVENFQYFLSVRQSRIEFLYNWIRREFGIKLDPGEGNIDELLDWAERYVPVLVPSTNLNQSCDVYYCYSRAWEGEYAGLNAFVDLGALLGELIIRRHPHLSWQMEWSLSDYPSAEQMLDESAMTMLRARERDIRHAKREKWAGYRRPIIASPTDPIPYHPVYKILDTYYLVISQYLTWESSFRDAAAPAGLHSKNQFYLRDWFKSA